MALDDELESLNVRIRQLRSQFDLFFAGAIPKPPLETRDLLDKEVKRIGTAREMKLAQRFLYNTLLNRWNVFSELWNKKLQEKEEGARTPVIARRRKAGRAAGAAPSPRAIPSGAQASPIRTRDGDSTEHLASPTPAQGVGAASDSPAAKSAVPEKRLVARAAIRDAVEVSGEEMKAFYKSFLEARQETGGGKAPSYEKFCQEIQRQAQTIREKTDCEKVDFRIYLEDNRLSFRARAVKEKETREVEEDRK